MAFPETTRLTATREPQDLRAVLGAPPDQTLSLVILNESQRSSLFFADAALPPDPTEDPAAFPISPQCLGDLTVDRTPTFFWGELGDETFLVGVSP